MSIATRYSKSLWSYNPIPTGCVLYLPLWSPGLSGSAFKSIDSLGHTATATNTTWYPYGRKFDNTADKIVVPDHAAFDLTDAVTIMAWIRLVNVAGTDMILSKRPLIAEYNYYLRSEAGFIRFAFYNGGHINLTDDTSRLVNNVWALVGATYQKTHIRIYKAGAEVKSAEQTAAMIANADDLDIGLDTYNDSSELEGDVGEVWEYNRALSAEEVLYTYERTKGRYL